MSQAHLVKPKTTSRLEAASAVTVQHGSSLLVAAGPGSSNDITTQGDLTSRRSQRFRSKVLPYWDFVRIACIPTSNGDKTFVACDVPGESRVESTVKIKPSQTQRENLSENKPAKRKMASQDVNTESTPLTGLPSGRGRISSTALHFTPNKTRLSVTPKKRRFSLGSDFSEGQSNVVEEECPTSGKKSASPRTLPSKLDKIKTVKRSGQTIKDKENFMGTHLKILKSNSSTASKNINKSSTSSSKDGTCETEVVDKPNDADETDVAKETSYPDEEKSEMNCPDQEKSMKDNGGSLCSPAAAASFGRHPSLDDPGYSYGNDSFVSTMAGSELQFIMIAGTENDNAAPTGQYRIARRVAANGISVYSIHLSKGYLAFRTPLKMKCIGMTGEGCLKLVNESTPSMEIKLQPDAEVFIDKDAVVSIAGQEGCSNLIVMMVTMDD